MHATAKWSESKVYPEYAGPFSYVEYANNFMSNPNRTLTQLGNDSVLLWIYIEENHGGTNTIESIMQKTMSTNGINAVDAALSTLGSSFAEAFKGWTIANFLKDSYYSKGHLFNSLPSVQLPTYNGTVIPHSSAVVDWGADYVEINSSFIYMPILFTGNQSHNLTKILIERNLPILADFPLNSTYDGLFPLMQANALDKIVIVIRSFGNETSSNRVAYSLTFLNSSYTFEDPAYSTSPTTTMTIIETTGTHLSSTLTLAVTGKSSSQSSSETPLNVILPDMTGPTGVPDGIVDIYDLAFVGKAYGTKEGDPNWNQYAIADITGPEGLPDGTVDKYDLTLFCKNYGKTI